MDKYELSIWIDSVLDKERNESSQRKLSWTIEEKEGVKTINYPHSDTLIDIFSNIQNNGELKKEFLEILKNRINHDEERVEQFYVLKTHIHRYITVVPLCFYTLIRLGFIEEGIRCISLKSNGLNGFIKILYELFKLEENYFNLKDLHHINSIIQNLNPTIDVFSTKNEVQSVIINKKYDIVKKQIKSVNLEINQDRKVVSEKIQYLNFDPKYNKFLIELDKFINTENSGLVNSGMISNLRTFMGDLIKDTVKKISSEDNEEIPQIEGRGEMGNNREYLKTKLGLSDKDDKFINSFIDILHKEGGHTFTSEKEYFRLTRNIGIEITLLILSKYEKRQKKSK